jgi:hypothetical protein
MFSLDKHQDPKKIVIRDHATPGMGAGLSSLQVEEITCNSKGGNHQKPQTHPTEQLEEKTRGGARQDRDSNPGGQARA